MNIKGQLEVLPIEIQEGRKFLVEIAAMLEDVTLKIKKWEASEMQDITNATDTNGKSKYSNAEKRQAELERRRPEDLFVSSLDEEYKSLKEKLEQSKIDLQYKIDVQENLRAIARLGGSEA